MARRTGMRRILLVACLAATSACVVRSAPPPRHAERHDNRNDRAFDRHSQWDKLGQRWIQGRVDRDVIPVQRRERYSRLRLVVEHSALELHDVVIYFGNGETFVPNTRLIFGNGSTTREIDLPGGLRRIDRIELRAGNLPGGGRAQVEVWGLGGRPT